MCFRTENAVIPYGVGVDIGCRMCLSVFDIDPKELTQKEQYFTRELKAATLFGGGRQFEQTTEHEVPDREEFAQLPLLKGLRDRAARQLGSSGSGNHFVEFGIVEIDEPDPLLKLKKGSYLGLLSHSGSRGLGAAIANHYTRIVKQKRRLPGEANNLAWLTLDEEEGIEHWLAMNLAGDYASACHEVIHEKIRIALGHRPVTRVRSCGWMDDQRATESGRLSSVRSSISNIAFSILSFSAKAIRCPLPGIIRISR